MDFALTEEQKMLKSNVRNFLEKEIGPVVNEYEKKGPLTKEAAVSFIKQLMPFGYMIGFLPEKYGGSSLDHKTHGVLYWASSRMITALLSVRPRMNANGMTSITSFCMKRRMRSNVIMSFMASNRGRK